MKSLYLIPLILILFTSKLAASEKYLESLESLQELYNGIVFDLPEHDDSRVNYGLFNSDRNMKRKASKYVSIGWHSKITEEMLCLANYEEPADDLQKWQRLAKAHFLNAYNFCMIKMIADYLKANPNQLETVKEKGLQALGEDAFDQRECKVGSKKLSLNDIRRILLDSKLRFYDPRSIYGLSSGAASDPRFSKGVFTSKNVDALLAELENEFWNSREASRLNIQNDVLYLNPIVVSSQDHLRTLTEEETFKSYILSVVEEAAIADFVGESDPASWQAFATDLSLNYTEDVPNSNDGRAYDEMKGWDLFCSK